MKFVTLLRYDVTQITLICLSSLLFSRALLEGKSIGNPIRGTWASIYQVYVVVVTATTLLLKLGTRVHDGVSKGTSLEGRALLSSRLFQLLGCKLSLILPKRLYGMTPVATSTGIVKAKPTDYQSRLEERVDNLAGDLATIKNPLQIQDQKVQGWFEKLA